MVEEIHRDMLPAREESHSLGVHIWSTSCLKNRNDKPSPEAAQRWEEIIIAYKTGPRNAHTGKGLSHTIFKNEMQNMIWSLTKKPNKVTPGDLGFSLSCAIY